MYPTRVGPRIPFEDPILMCIPAITSGDLPRSWNRPRPLLLVEPKRGQVDTGWRENDQHHHGRVDSTICVDNERVDQQNGDKVNGITSLNPRISRGGKQRVIFSHSSNGNEGICEVWADMFSLMDGILGAKVGSSREATR